MKKHIFLVAMVLAFASFNAFAQQVIDPKVEVNRDFTGKMLEVHKSKLNTNINDSLNRFNLDFNYTIFDKPYKDLYEFTPLPSAQIHSPVQTNMPMFMAKAGIGFPLYPNVEFWFSPKLGYRNENGIDVNNNTILFNGFYNYFSGKIPLLCTNATSYKTMKSNYKVFATDYAYGIGADYSHTWKGGEFGISLKYNGGFNTYYGFNTNYLSSDFIDNLSKKGFLKDKDNNLNHSYNQLDAAFNIKSVDAKSKGARFNYAFAANYKRTQDAYPAIDNVTKKLNENYVLLNGEMGPTFGKYSKFMLGLNFQAVNYGGVTNYHYGLFEILPQYKFDKGRWQFNLGIKLSGKFTNAKNDADKFHNVFFPKADISYEIVKNNLWAFGLVDGANNINAYSYLLSNNKWINPASTSADIKESSIPLLVKVGLKGKTSDVFSYQVFACYTIHNGLLSFVIDWDDPWFYTFYSNHRELSFGGELALRTKDVTAGFNAKYSSFTKSRKSTLLNNVNPAGYPPFKANFFAEYNWRERIFAGASLTIHSATPYIIPSQLVSSANAIDYKMSGFANVGINARYVFDNIFSFYIKADNLLNEAVQYYPNYVVKGINFEAGVIVKF